MGKIYIIDQPRSKPIYDNKGRFLYWRLAYNVNDNQTELRYFKNTLLSRGYQKLCRFQQRLVLKQNENNK